MSGEQLSKSGSKALEPVQVNPRPEDIAVLPGFTDDFYSGGNLFVRYVVALRDQELFDSITADQSDQAHLYKNN